MEKNFTISKDGTQSLRPIGFLVLIDGPETVETRCVFSRENRGNFHAVYIAKVRITVRGQDAEIARERPRQEKRMAVRLERYDVALKAAETDATKRALTTFGKRFGLMLYGRKLRNNKISQNVSSAEDGAVERYPNTPFRNDDMDWVPLQLDEINKIDKSLLRFGAPRRIRNRAHLKYIAAQSCLICGRVPFDAHHLKFAQPRALGLKVSDEFTVLVRGHHRGIMPETS